MSPRPYRLGRRRAASEETRARIVAAARELIIAGSGAFSIDSVAEQAGVARMTVYYQFRSKVGLLEALFDDLASRGIAGELPAAYAKPEPLDALAELITVFGRFWSAERLVIRRIRGLAALDPDFEQSLSAREERRRHGLRTILARIVHEYGPPKEPFEETVDILYTLTSFETFDRLAGAARSPKEVVPVVQRLARLLLGIDDAPSSGR